MPRIFISHSTQDHEIIEREIVAPLRAHGLETWFSTDNIRSASEWERQIHEGLKKCDWFLIALSPRSVASEWVKREVHWAFIRREDKVVPVMLESCDPDDLHIGLLPLQFIDFRQDLAVARERLLAVWGLDQATRIETQYQAAREALDKEDWATAVDRLDAVLRLDPAHARVQADLKRARQAQLAREPLDRDSLEAAKPENRDAAGEKLQKVTAADPDNAAAGLKRFEEAGTPSPGADTSHADQTTTEFDDASARRTKLLFISVGAVILLVLALSAYLFWPKRHTFPGETNYLQGQTLYEQKNYAGAEAEYRKAIALEPENARYYLNLAFSLIPQDKYEEAEAACKKALQLDPNEQTAKDLLRLIQQR